jgi:hypothetical protein
MPILKNPQCQYVCVIVVVLFFSLLLSHVHFGDRSAVMNMEEPSLRTFGSVFSILSSAAYQVCRSALLKSFWMDPLSNETYFCSSFVVNSSRLVSGPFFLVLLLILF